MGRSPAPARRRTVAPVALLVGAAAYAGVVAATRPFTLAADLAAALPLAVGAGWTVVTLVRRRAGTAVAGPVLRWRAALPWVALLAALVAFELYCFFGGPRPTHPTLSSFTDDLDRWRAAKAALALGWLALGRELVRR